MKNTIVIVGVILILFVLVGSVVLQLSGTTQSAQVSQRMVWQAPVAGGEIETLEVTDFSGNGEDEILAQTPAQVAVVSTQGKMLLSQDVFNAKTAIGDLDGNGAEEFVVAEPQGGALRVAAYTGDGTSLWETLVPDVGAPSRGLTLDFEDDRKREVVFGTDSGVLVCLEGRTGELRWQYTFPPDLKDNLLVRGTDDAWRDGRRYLAAAVYGGHVVLLDEAGSPVWEKDFPQPVRRLRAYDMDGDGTSEILLGGLNGLVWLVSGTGDNPLWQTSIGSRVDEARFLELDGNPTQTEVIIGGKNGGVSAYTQSGTSLWQRTLSGKVREFAALDYDDDGQNEVLVAANKVYLLGGRTGDLLATFPVAAPSILEAEDFGGEKGYVAGAGQGVAAFQVSVRSQPWWYSPITAGFLVSLIMAAFTVVLSRFNWEKTATYSVQDQSLEVLKARKKMLREVLEDTEQIYRDRQISAHVYLEKSRQEREQLAAVEEQILKLDPNYTPEVMRCPACGGPVEVGVDRCQYCHHVLL
jgi:outer membrane protein assembly factor BamB